MNYEYAYYDGMFKGNSKRAVERLRELTEVMISAGIEEIVYRSGSEAVAATASPFPAIAIVEGAMTEAKLALRRLMREIGAERGLDAIEEAIKFAEEIESLPIEEALRRARGV